MKKALILIIAVILAGCGTARPVLYPNTQVQQAGEVRAQQDIDECTRKAETYVKDNPAGDVAKSTATGAIVGAAVGAAVGAITGDFGQGLAIGASSGGIWGFFGGLFQAAEPSPVHKQFVERCLREKGYEPIGWK
jgi:outer membrane lipoprotein SlyB